MRIQTGSILIISAFLQQNKAVLHTATPTLWLVFICDFWVLLRLQSRFSTVGGSREGFVKKGQQVQRWNVDVTVMFFLVNSSRHSLTFKKHGCSKHFDFFFLFSAFKTLYISENTPMMTLSHSPSVLEHPVHISPLDHEHKGKSQYLIPGYNAQTAKDLVTQCFNIYWYLT